MQILLLQLIIRCHFPFTWARLSFSYGQDTPVKVILMVICKGRWLVFPIHKRFLRIQQANLMINVGNSLFNSDFYAQKLICNWLLGCNFLMSVQSWWKFYISLRLLSRNFICECVFNAQKLIFMVKFICESAFQWWFCIKFYFRWLFSTDIWVDFPFRITLDALF